MDRTYHAHRDLRTILAPILGGAGFGCPVLLLSGLAILPSALGWGELTLGVALLFVTIGIWNAREWARWATGAFAVVYFVWGAVQVLSSRDGTTLLFAFPGMTWVAFIVGYTLLPGGQRRFEEARAAIARARTAKSGSTTEH